MWPFRKKQPIAPSEPKPIPIDAAFAAWDRYNAKTEMLDDPKFEKMPQTQKKLAIEIAYDFFWEQLLKILRS